MSRSKSAAKPLQLEPVSLPGERSTLELVLAELQGIKGLVADLKGIVQESSGRADLARTAAQHCASEVIGLRSDLQILRLMVDKHEAALEQQRLEKATRIGDDSPKSGK
jgi:hypothetical protein